ncbi:uncharacterized protein CC84DRAFT_386104 [Paraphaeosphaeria sporulosa]|uniref:C2H2-type domain-containing protein n=1 Tax=Paraphaeosphaeria sporulosa TaxID=1460663 RepID=A0A177BVL4_9PLEO|nr:uncharacterized protein CC84DRAFT_386104 [Paraphaeosphaeria sporulosa]OAF99195.1 hypothetical protein CC84DRAFT_386104 [Paraphaeosphaeria sporulosa]
MKGGQTDPGWGGGMSAVGRGAQAESSGGHKEYELALQSTNTDIQVRYVDRQDEPSSYPYWVITDNTTPKYDPYRGFWSRDRKEVESDSIGKATTTTELTHDVVADDSIAGTADDVDYAASDVEDEEDSEQFLRGAAATRNKKSVRFAEMRLFRTSFPSSMSNPSKSDDFTAQISAPQLGTERANRPVRAAARKAKLNNPASDVSANISSEARRISQVAERDYAFDVDNTVARVRVTRDRGLRVRQTKPDNALYASLAFEEESGKEEERQGVNKDDIHDTQEHGVLAQILAYGGNAQGGSNQANEADEADWTPRSKTGRPATRGRQGKGVQEDVVKTAAAKLHKPRGTARWKPDPIIERPFVCNICSAAFVRQQHLKRHERSVQRCQRTVQFEAYHRNVQRFFGVGPYVRTCMATRTKLRTYSFWIGKVR